jgi:ADP-heptose:LPS heptosyltransferase
MVKIVIIRLSSLGDIVLLTPIPKTIKEVFKDAEITLITKPQYVPIFENYPYIDFIVPFNSIRETKRRLKNESFDIVIDLHYKPITILLSLSLNTRRRLWIRKRLLSWWSAVHLKKKIPEKHIIDLYFDTISPICKKIIDKSPFLSISDLEKKWAESRVRDLKRPIVGFAIGAKKKVRRWTGFGKLSQIIDETIILFGDKEDRESLKDMQFRKDRVIDSIGKLTIRETIALLEKCDLLVCNDSGLGHIASAVKTPVISIFGPTIREFGFAPYGEKNIVLSKPLPCKPCSLHGEKKCKRGDNLCLKLITPEEVKKEIEKFM